MDIANNSSDFTTAQYLLCTLHMVHMRNDRSACDTSACPLASSVHTSHIFDFYNYSLQRRKEIAALYSSIGLPDDSDEAAHMAKVLNLAGWAFRQLESERITHENDEEYIENESESPVLPEEAEVIRITRDHLARPVLYVHGERVCYGNHFAVEGDTDGELTCDYMGVPV